MPNEQTFTFKECYDLLNINPKSFLEWLRKAKIDPNAQVNKFDPRKKFVTKSQLLQLAEAHGRILPPLEDDEQTKPGGDTGDACRATRGPTYCPDRSRPACEATDAAGGTRTDGRLSVSL